MLRSLQRPALALALGGAAMLAACSDNAAGPVAPGQEAPALSASGTGEFVIVGSGGSLPADLEARVSAAGGTLRRVFPEIGVAVAAAPDPGFATRAAAISGVESAVPDVVLRWTGERRVTEMAEGHAAPLAAAPVASRADDEPFYAFQWAPGAVQAPEAWNAGLTGRGVRVAVVDGGLYASHADLRANVDVAASRSFVPGTTFDQDLGTFWHGTHVAGIIGAADNGIGVIGIAPEATLIGVKVLHGGSGSFSWIIDGIMYAARPRSEGGAGAQVINMSLGGAFDGKDQAVKAAVQELSRAVDRATRYAHEQGATLIAAAGNDGINFDEAKTRVGFPAQSAHVISVAATGPLGWAYGATDFSRPASYTTHGKAVVTLAAPGGEVAYPGNEACTLSGFTTSCWAFDMYLSTSRGTTAGGAYSWSAGTSMASPVAAGVAALVIQAGGGALAPAGVQARLRGGATDLGKPGKDEFYGHGFVNALRSVR